jgi:hypothetical protein
MSIAAVPYPTNARSAINSDLYISFNPLVKNVLQVLRAFGIPQRKHLYFISVSGAFLGTSLPPTPNWSRFDPLVKNVMPADLFE